MKKEFMFLLITLLSLGSQSVFADSYQRWIVWVSEPKHVTNEIEMMHIFSSLCDGKISSGTLYEVGGVSFTISSPDQYLHHLKRCIQKSDPSATTVDGMKNAIRGGEVVRWGNDISCKVKNYWVKLNGEVTFTDSYSGAELGVWVLLINGIPTIKLDCGNPLEIIVIVADNVPAPIQMTPPPTPVTPCCGNTTINSNNTTTNITNNYYGNDDGGTQQTYSTPLDTRGNRNDYSYGYGGGSISVPVSMIGYGGYDRSCRPEHRSLSRPEVSRPSTVRPHNDRSSYSTPTRSYSGQPATNAGSGGSGGPATNSGSGGSGGPATNTGSGGRR